MNKEQKFEKEGSPKLQIEALELRCNEYYETIEQQALQLKALQAANKKNGRSEDILILNSVEAGGVAVYNAEGHWDVYITDADNQSTEGVKDE